jgi:hypothetical protein
MRPQRFERELNVEYESGLFGRGFQDERFARGWIVATRQLDWEPESNGRIEVASERTVPMLGWVLLLEPLELHCIPDLTHCRFHLFEGALERAYLDERCVFALMKLDPLPVDALVGPDSDLEAVVKFRRRGRAKDLKRMA